MIAKAPRGTKDVIPQEVYKWHYVEEKIHNLCKRFGYKEVRIPVFEHTEVFERGVGDTTDVVQKEMYTFDDKGGRSITLRPEGTSGTVRCFLENNLFADAQPTKMYYLLSCYRYEKPQAGRFREFHQFGVESFGSPDASIDAEVISMAINLLNDLNIKDIKLYINSIGCPSCREKYNIKLKKYFEKYKDELCETCRTRLEKNPMRIIDCKVPHCSELGVNAPKILNEQCSECSDHYNKLCKYLDFMGINYQIDDTIVRGLDYYTTTVFEIKSGGLVVCGGGRYNGLVEELGGKPTPGVGFGLGLERLLLTLEKQGIMPEYKSDVQIYIANIGEKADLYAQKIVNELRKNGICAEKDLLSRSLKAQMKYADKIGAKYTAVIGDDEINN
ncbi:MAG: histidine--tRNA ligase, partial [Clostridia bacterium]|nr:histidine--tRNA ligase [Clostridia bacterium]